MTKDEILAFEPPAAKMLGREVVEIDHGERRRDAALSRSRNS